jgi:hypothetical protein
VAFFFAIAEEAAGQSTGREKPRVIATATERRSFGI